jgi:hypothetical protein
MVPTEDTVNQDILDECAQAFSSDIISGLSEEDLNELMVYDVFTSLNGAAGVTYVDKMNRNTSAGFPWNKSKKFLMRACEPTESVPDPVEIDQEVLDRVDIIITKYRSGIRYKPVFTGHLKDEAVSFKKIAEGKTRVFAGGPVDWCLVVRMYCLSFVRVLQKNRFVFESGPGTVAQSLEWEEIREYLVQHGEERIIAGDFKSFDKSMRAIFILKAFWIIKQVCKAAGWSNEDLLMIQMIGEDTAFPVMNFNGDLIELYGSNPSGHPLTVIVNGLVNSLYMRYCYKILNPLQEVASFKRCVSLMTYGDDNIMGVSKACSWFTHTSLCEAMKTIGVVYNQADKEAESRPILHNNEASFLKRTWRWDEDIRAYVAPLEHDSINKSLTVCVRSKSVTPEQQAVSEITSAIREYFWYGKDVFMSKCAMFREVIDEAGLASYEKDSTLPSWDQLYEEFWFKSKDVRINRLKVQGSPQGKDELPYVNACRRCHRLNCQYKRDFVLTARCPYCLKCAIFWTPHPCWILDRCHYCGKLVEDSRLTGNLCTTCHNNPGWLRRIRGHIVRHCTLCRANETSTNVLTERFGGVLCRRCVEHPEEGHLDASRQSRAGWEHI